MKTSWAWSLPGLSRNLRIFNYFEGNCHVLNILLQHQTTAESSQNLRDEMITAWESLTPLKTNYFQAGVTWVWNLGPCKTQFRAETLKREIWVMIKVPPTYFSIRNLLLNQTLFVTHNYRSWDNGAMSVSSRYVVESGSSDYQGNKETCSEHWSHCNKLSLISDYNLPDSCSHLYWSEDQVTKTHQNAIKKIFKEPQWLWSFFVSQVSRCHSRIIYIGW